MRHIQSLLLALLSVGALGLGTPVHAAARTTYPVVFAHGMAGFDNLLGYDYWGDDYGTFVGDPCDELLEVYCNGDLDSGQKAYVARRRRSAGWTWPTTWRASWPPRAPAM
jgi:triacylglycerol lipase